MTCGVDRPFRRYPMGITWCVSAIGASNIVSCTPMRDPPTMTTFKWDVSGNEIGELAQGDEESARSSPTTDFDDEDEEILNAS